MRFLVSLLALLIIGLACKKERDLSDNTSDASSKVTYPERPLQAEPPPEIPQYVQQYSRTIAGRFLLPDGYTRKPILENSYASYLRNLKLKADKSKVELYNGQLKSNQDIHAAVIDLPIGNKDLHQCADAIMRLRAEYLWREEKYDDIHFNFTNGFTVAYTEWMRGRRMVVKGNKTYWDDTDNPSNTYEDFWEYMELIFMYAGTLSLSKELKSVPILEMQIGDIFILGGSPGHAVVVVDIATNDKGEKIFMLAQSYMPAQEMHVLKNLNEEISPWYSLTDNDEIMTPEWTFTKNQLMRFRS